MKKENILGFLKTKGRLVALIVLGSLGVFLLLFAGVKGESGEVAAGQDNTAEREAFAEYEAALEKELELFCESAAGVSDVHVMVSFSEGYSRRYVKDENGKPVTVGSGSSARALEEGTMPPTVSGVGIVCRRGNDPTVQKTLTELVSTALGIPTNRVFVTGR